MELSPHEQFLITALRRLEGGTLLEQFADQFGNVADRVRKLQKPGGLTLKLAFRGEGQEQLTIAGEVDAKLPKKAPMATTFFIAPDGQVTPDDPMQTDMHDIKAFVPPERDTKDFTPRSKGTYDPTTGEVSD